MKKLSEKLTGYIIRVGAVSKESYAVYQYGFQIGLEMLCCFWVSLFIAVYLHMVPGFIVFTGIFMLLRTYAGGVHLDSFLACFTCSVIVQILVFISNRSYRFSLIAAWIIILVGTILILKLAPVENINHELDSTERVHCKQVTLKIIIGITIFAECCTLREKNEIVSLVAITILIVLISQYIGKIKFKIEKQMK